MTGGNQRRSWSLKEESKPVSVEVGEGTAELCPRTLSQLLVQENQAFPYLNRSQEGEGDGCFLGNRDASLTLK